MIERTLIEMDRRRYRWNDEELKKERGSAQEGARKCSRRSEEVLKMERGSAQDEAKMKVQKRHW